MNDDLVGGACELGPRVIFCPLHWEEEQRIRFVVATHHGLPLAWDADYEVRPEGVEHDVRQLSDASLAKDRAVLAALNREGAVIAFHWLAMSYEPVPRATIQSLWTEPSWRQRGIARELKRLGEAWARSAGARAIVTNVSFENRAMIRLNEDFGFRIDVDPPDRLPTGYLRMS